MRARQRLSVVVLPVFWGKYAVGSLVDLLAEEAFQGSMGESADSARSSWAGIDLVSLLPGSRDELVDELALLPARRAGGNHSAGCVCHDHDLHNASPIGTVRRIGRPFIVE